MARAEFHVFGLGWGADDLRYVGWTRRSLDNEQEQIFTDMVASGGRDIANWVAEGLRRGKMSLFEIQSAPSLEEARTAADSLCRYFKSLGLDVKTASAEAIPVHGAQSGRTGSHAHVADRRSNAEDSRVPA